MYLVSHYQIKLIRKEVKHHIISGASKNQLVLLKFEKQEINHRVKWKHSKEFVFEGGFYDIVERKEEKDSIFLWCWPDDKETFLNIRLNNALAFHLQSNDHHQKLKVSLNKLIKTLFIHDFDSFKSEAPPWFKMNNWYVFNPRIIKESTSPPSPPPELLIDLVAFVV